MVLVVDAGILRSEDISTPIVSLVYDVDGEVAAGVAGVDEVVRIFFVISYNSISAFLIEIEGFCSFFYLVGKVSYCLNCFLEQEKFLTPEWIERFEYKISSAPVVMVDANLSTLALEAACKCNAYSFSVLFSLIIALSVYLTTFFLKWLQSSMFLCGLSPCQSQSRGESLQLLSM